MRCDRKHFLLHPCTWPAWPHHWAPAGCSLPTARAWFPDGAHHSYRAKTHYLSMNPQTSAKILQPQTEQEFVDSKSLNILRIYFISSKCAHPQTPQSSEGHHPKFCCFLAYRVFHQIGSSQDGWHLREQGPHPLTCANPSRVSAL